MRPAASVTSAHIHDVIRGNDGRLYAATSAGELLVSEDGLDWEVRSSGTKSCLWGLTATSDGTLVCVGADGTFVEVLGLDRARQ